MIHISSRSRHSALRTLAILGATALSTAAFADQISLESADGTVNLVGEFVDFSDGHYVIRTELGDLRIMADRVRCKGAACPRPGTGDPDFTVAGAGTIGTGMMPLLMSGYAGSMQADAQLTDTGANEVVATLIGDDGFGAALASYEVSSTSTEDAFKALLDNRAQVAMATRRIQPAEARALRAAGSGDMESLQNEHIIAIDSVMIIANPANPVGQITMAQLRDVYAGKIANWKQLGGPDTPISVIDYGPDAAPRAFLDDRLFGKAGAAFDGAARIAGDEREMAAMVNADPAAIGYVGFAFRQGAKPLTLVSSCGLPSRPDLFSAKTEEYGLNRRLYLYTTDKTDPKVMDFVNYVQSPQADDIIARAGFIDQGIVARAQDAASDRAGQLAEVKRGYAGKIARRMMASMEGTDRLSTTFRFRSGVSRLDNKADSDLVRLVDYLRTQPEGTKVTLVGFSDNVGPFESNRRLSERRAAQVLREIKTTADGALANIDFQTAGFGELAPSACNVSADGRAINRRVEVWMQHAG